jgi:acyl-CoA dehydrogenase
MTLAYVPARSAGISTEPLHNMGRHALSQAVWTYQNVRIPRHYVLGDLGRGFPINMEGFNFARVLVASACAGAAERALEIARDHVKSRHAFGRPIAKFEGVSFQIAEDLARLEQIKLLIQRSAWMVDRSYAEPGSVTHQELNAAASMCKLEAPQIAFEICKHTLMHQGAYGYSDASPMGMAMRGIMSYLAGAEGSMNIQKLIIAREFIGDEAVPYR